MSPRHEPPRLFAGELRAIGAALVLALLILAALVASHLGAFLMKRLSILAVLAATALLAGCSATGQTVLNNVDQHCDRHYDGSINAGLTGANFTGTFKADCHAADGKTAPAAAQ